jgi:hypothetical protein
VGAMISRTEKLLRWFMFSVLASLVPLALTYFSHRIDRHAVRLEMLLGRGELLLITTTLGAAALGELIPANRENAIAKVLAGGASVLMIVISSVCFAAIQSRNNADPRPVAVLSLAFFFGTLLAAASCLFYSHQEAR